MEENQMKKQKDQEKYVAVVAYIAQKKRSRVFVKLSNSKNRIFLILTFYMHLIRTCNIKASQKKLSNYAFKNTTSGN